VVKKCEGSLPKAKGKIHYMEKMMHTTKLKRHKRNKYDEGSQIEIGRTKQEHKHKEQRCNGKWKKR